jgi:hypothetical protein
MVEQAAHNPKIGGSNMPLEPRLKNVKNQCCFFQLKLERIFVQILFFCCALIILYSRDRSIMPPFIFMFLFIIVSLPSRLGLCTLTLQFFMSEFNIDGQGQ